MESLEYGFGAEYEEGWAVDKFGILGEEFLVDDLLDLGGLTETGKEDVEEEEEQQQKVEEESVVVVEQDSSNSNSSAVSFELPPVSELTLPVHDVAELEWVSRIMDDSEFPPFNPAPKPYTQAPSCFVSAAAVPVKAKRSKRTRTHTHTHSGSWTSWGPPHFADSTTTSSTSLTTSSSCSSTSSHSYSSQLIFVHPLFDESPSSIPKKQKPKKRGRKPKVPTQEPWGPTAGERRCSHCGVNKTPQWRAGPMGSKTLCNACGVRFKSGRLLPEYRPACSPTFISHVHSNSHRRVLEMRRKKEEEENVLLVVSSAPPVTSF